MEATINPRQRRKPRKRANKMCLPIYPFKIEREWEHAGLKCAVVQAREASHRCAYVRVPPTHPLHGKGYEDADVNVHGGLIFAQGEPCDEKDGRGWWFGFDFAHCDDAIYDPNPNMATLSDEAKEMLRAMNKIREIVGRQMQDLYIGSYTRPRKHFWTQIEVERQCEDLAEQLAALR